MTAVLLIIHLLVAAALVGVILMQRSEGGALGIGGGGPGGMMSGRGAANLLTRLTMLLGAVFIGNSLLLAVISGADRSNNTLQDRVQGSQSEPASTLPLGDNFDQIDSEPASSEDTPAQDPVEEDEPELPGR